MVYYLDGLPVQLKAPHDLSWTGRYGRVFCVFDQLISGNLCLGVEAEGKRYFIKYAGAATLGYAGDPALAVMRLRSADGVYQQLYHRCLTRRLDGFETRTGFGLVFDWFPGFALAPLELHMRRLRALPLASRYALFDGLAEFIALASKKDYVTAGIRDQNILIDFERERALFCSVDHFIPLPAINTRGRLPGSPWFLAPEAYQRGTPLSETTNVYQLGMLAHSFFGDRQRPHIKGWESTQGLFEVADKACQPDPEKRHQEAAQFLAAWRQGVMAIPSRYLMG